MSLAYALPPSFAAEDDSELVRRIAMLAGKEICASKPEEKRAINAKRSFASSSVPARFRA